jgi:hypothetical protein
MEQRRKPRFKGSKGVTLRPDFIGGKTIDAQDMKWVIGTTMAGHISGAGCIHPVCLMEPSLWKGSSYHDPAARSIIPFAAFKHQVTHHVHHHVHHHDSAAMVAISCWSFLTPGMQFRPS